jgi:hypothetical protein
VRLVCGFGNAVVLCFLSIAHPPLQSNVKDVVRLIARLLWGTKVCLCLFVACLLLYFAFLRSWTGPRGVGWVVGPSYDSAAYCGKMVRGVAFSRFFACVKGLL